jgi:hypothetical protein
MPPLSDRSSRFHERAKEFNELNSHPPLLGEAPHPPSPPLWSVEKIKHLGHEPLPPHDPLSLPFALYRRPTLKEPDAVFKPVVHLLLFRRCSVPKSFKPCVRLEGKCLKLV